MAGMLEMPSGKLTPDAIEKQLHLTPQQNQQFDRIVLAGAKVMFSKESHHLMLKEMDGPGTMSQKLGQGIAGLMGLLMQESKGALPPVLVIPAGMVLLATAAEFLRKSGTDVSEQEVGSAIGVMVNAILHAAGVNPDKLASAVDRAESKQAKPTQAPAPVKGAPA